MRLWRPPYPASTALPIVTPLPDFDGAKIEPSATFSLDIRIGDAGGYRLGRAVTQGCALQPLCPSPRILGSRHCSNPGVCASEAGECSARLLAARNAISNAGRSRLLMFWMVFPGARLPDSTTSMTWTTVAPMPKTVARDDGGLTEAIAPAHGDNAKDADGQVGNADLELEGATGRPADGLRDRVRDEDVAMMTGKTEKAKTRIATLSMR